MEPRLGTPRQRVQVILVDQADESNGWATVVPYNVIEITAAPPRASSVIGNTDDWLRLVFTHEYTHVIHLEKSGGWLGRLRHVFGRLPLFYPNLFLPGWQVEGLATFEESALAGGGRVNASDFRMILDHLAAARRYATLDRANGGVVDWPSGNTTYLYGGFFHECLSRRYGDESHARLATETARRIPFLGSRAFREVYGRPLGDLWRECQADVQQGARIDEGDRQRLTRHGFIVTSPAFAADGRLFYSIANPHGFPALMERARDRSEPREVTTRFRGERIAVAGNTLVFDQLEVVREVDVQSDLYALSLRGGDVRRLTREARAADPDVAPDGRTVVCTAQQADRRLIATFTMPPDGSVATPQPLVSEPFTEFTSPRWSPDGRTIVAERRHLGGPSEIVLIDVETRSVRPLVASAEARNISPAWMPDGRSVLFSSNRGGRPFTIHAVDVATGRVRRLAGAGDGAQSPAIAPDGRSLVFVGYSADGYDLYSLPFDSPRWEDAGPSSLVPGPESLVASPESRVASPESRVPSASRQYQPWQTLTPRFWTPVIESDADAVTIGAATGGYDALGRHGYAIVAGWTFDRNRPAWQADYTYARWWPALFVNGSDDTDAWRSGDVRVRELNAGALFPLRRVRWFSQTLTAVHVADERYECLSCAPAVDETRRRIAARVGWTLSSAQSFGYSISAEQGAAATVTSEWTRRALGADADAGAASGELRGYLRAGPRHAVIAARAAAATSWGDDAMRRVFSAAGAGPQTGGFEFDSGAIGLLRGIEESAVIGRHAAVANVDYRFPLGWPQRGIGTLPLLLRSVHGAVFADAGHAWTDSFRRRDISHSLGAELSFDVVLGYSAPVTIATGAAWRRIGDGRRSGIVAFGRIGRAF